MNILPNKHWIPLTPYELASYLQTQNYLRDAWSDCDLFFRHGTGERIAALLK